VVVGEAADAGAVGTTTDPAASLVTAPSAVPKATATVKPPRQPPVGATVKATATAEPKPPPTVSADCTTPVWFDAQGVKHYKPQCLDK
jgi:hypothetical protein